MQIGERPVGAGIFFALGHSSVVFIAVALAGAATTLLGPAQWLKSVGGVAGTRISTLFFLVIAGGEHRYSAQRLARVEALASRSFMANAAGAAFVNAVGPIQQLVRGAPVAYRRCLVIAPGLRARSEPPCKSWTGQTSSASIDALAIVAAPGGAGR